MELNYYSAAFTTGALSQMELPLEDVTLSSNIERPGDMSATLDLRRLTAPTSSWTEQLQDATAALDMIRAGARSIVPIREGITAGDTGEFDKAMGEWWITNVEATHSDPIVKITGVEVAGYTSHCVITRNWNLKSIDPVAQFRRVMFDMFNSGQEIACNVGSGGSTAVSKQEFKITAGATTYEAALNELAGDQFEWWISPTIITSGGIPTRVQRTLMLRAPRIEVNKTKNIALEALTPGVRPGPAIDMSRHIAVEDMCTDLWAFGSGAGAKQVSTRVNTITPAGLPRLSRTWTARDQPSKTTLLRQATRIRSRMSPVYEPFTAVASMDLMPGGGPRVGDVYWVSREPSLSMPQGEQFTARVLSWAWKQPKPGEQELVTLTMERR